MTKKIISIFLAITMILSLGACGKKTEGSANLVVEGNAIPGFIPSEIAIPSELGTLEPVWDAQGDAMILCGRGGSSAIGCYDTINESWTLLNYDISAFSGSSAVCGVSAAGNTVWALFEVRDEQSWNSSFWMFFCDTTQGTSGTIKEIPFSGGESTEAAGLYFTAVYALDDQKAILCAGEQGYLVDSDMNLLQKLDLQGCLFQSSLRAGSERIFLSGSIQGQSYVTGCCTFDAASLNFGPTRELEFNGNFFSERSRWLNSVDGYLCEIDPETGEVIEPLFRWIDVALSLSSRGGFAVFENSDGDFYYPVIGAKSLIRVTPGMVKERQTLILGSFGHAQGAMSDREYDLSNDLLDAVIRFNNTNPDYKVEIRELKWETEGERDRLLIELATGSDIDILDTSGLPERSLDSGLLLDLLPYIDADEDLSRDDFIQPLLNAMLQNGALYELTAKVSLIGFAAHPDLFSGRENWTAEEAERQMQNIPEGWQLFPSWEDREFMLDMLAKMATAEFVDWESGTCSFESDRFKAWLQLVKDAPYSMEYSEDPQLLYMSWDFPMDAGASIRMGLHDDYVFCGFPGTTGSGCYFIPLGTGPDEYRTTCGVATRLGIMASSNHPEGAWQFVRILLTNGAESDITTGIPVLKSSFEAALQNSITDQDIRGYANFNSDDAERMRDVVYSTDKLVHCDETLLNIIKTEARGYFNGQLSLDDAASRIQSSARLYVAEQHR